MEANDASWYKVEPTMAALPKSKYIFSSQYITMSDGCKIALDLYLPPNYKPNSSRPLPTVLHLTRYNRNWKVRWPWTMLLGSRLNVRTPYFVERFVTIPSMNTADESTGPPQEDSCIDTEPVYAFVAVDVRGTGASFGVRHVDLAPREVQDFQEILKWTVAQAWCNGRVGSGGISYDGMTAAQLAAGDTGGSSSHVKAVALMFSPVDLYKDLCYPGGVSCKGFLESYRQFTFLGERNKKPTGIPKFPWKLWAINLFLLDGAAPVDDSTVEGRATFLAAIAEHTRNWDMVKSLKQVEFISDPMVGADESISTTSDTGTTDKTLQQIRDNGTAVYTFSGYYDSGSVRSAMRVHAALAQPVAVPAGSAVCGSVRNKITIGPWNHGARKIGSPYTTVSQPAFDLYYDAKRFFDLFVAGDGTGKEGESTSIASEMPVHYFELGSEKCVACDSWPVADVTWVTFSLGADRMLTSSPKGSDENQRETERLDVDTTLTSGVGSRWNLVQHIIRNPMEFNTSSPPPPARGRVVYTSPPLEKDLVIVGAPRLRLSLRLIGGTDTVVYAYLLDLAPERVAEEPSGATSKNSDITGHQQPQGVYLTEGLLRAASRHSTAPDCQPTLSLGTLPLHSNLIALSSASIVHRLSVRKKLSRWIFTWSQ